MRRPLGVLAATMALLLAGGTASFAAPSPDYGPVAGDTEVVVERPSGPVATTVSAGTSFSLSSLDDGRFAAWGLNTSGQLGDGQTLEQVSPTVVQPPAGVSFTQLSAGAAHALAVGDDGKVYAWGNNGSGQLGNGTTSIGLAPSTVLTPEGVTFGQVSAGSTHSLALGDDGNVYAWGSNSYGQIGDGTTETRLVPVQIPAPDGVRFVGVSAGLFHSLALGDDGNVYGWGRNYYRQLGDGTSADRLTPTRADAPAGVRFSSISSGYYHSLALTVEGVAYAWGYNTLGQLGDGTSTTRSRPIQVQMPTGVRFREMSGGYYHSLAVGENGQVYSWGQNSYGQLGDGTTTDRSTPVGVDIPGESRVLKASAGYSHSVAVGTDGTVYAWGRNQAHQLGDGTTANSSTPVIASMPEVVVTRITFGGLDGTALNATDPAAVSVRTPAHEAGQVDVVVYWTFGGVEQDPVTYANGFTYTSAPALTDPADVSVLEGQPAEFTVSVSGYPDPTISWELSTDGGATWSAIDGASGAHLNLPTTRLSDSGNQYRAVASNLADRVQSAAATLTVTAQGGGGVDDQADDEASKPDEPAEQVQKVGALPTTGGGSAAWMLELGLLLVAGGAGAFLGSRRSESRS